MKQKLSTFVLAIAVVLTLNAPAFASCGRPPLCDDAFLWQLLQQCCGCTRSGTVQGDWNALLRQWLAQPEQPEENGEPEPPEQTPVETQKPEEPDTPAETEAPAESEKHEEPEAGADSAVRAYEREVVRLVNVERAKYGLAALKEDAKLSAVARLKSQDMHDRGYFDHNSPTYGTPFQMMKSFGVSYRTAGENIAMGYRTPEAVVNAWINSEGHRANILNASYTSIGVGYVASGNYWTQHFVG